MAVPAPPSAAGFRLSASPSAARALLTATPSRHHRLPAEPVVHAEADDVVAQVTGGGALTMRRMSAACAASGMPIAEAASKVCARRFSFDPFDPGTGRAMNQLGRARPRRAMRRYCWEKPLTQTRATSAAALLRDSRACAKRSWPHMAVQTRDCRSPVARAQRSVRFLSFEVSIRAGFVPENRLGIAGGNASTDISWREARLE